MWSFFKKKSKSNIPMEELRRMEMQKAKAQFPGFAFTEEYGNVDLSEFLFLDEKNKQIGIYKSPETVLTIPFEHVAEIVVTNNHGNEMTAISEFDGSAIWNEGKIEDLLEKFDRVTYDTIFSQLLLSINNTSISLYDASNPRSNKERSIKRVKRWFRMLAINSLIEHERLKVEKINSEKEEFLESLEVEKPQRQSFYLAEIFREYDLIIQELYQGPFSTEGFEGLMIKAFRNGTVFLWDSEGEYQHTDYNQRWLNHVFQKRGIVEVKVLSANEGVDKTFLINNPALTERLLLELTYLSSLYNMEEKLSKAKIVKLKGKKIYFACEEGEDWELNIWWSDVISHYDWIPSFFQSLVGREYELIFESNMDQNPSTMNYDEVWTQAVGDRLLTSQIQSFQDNTYFIYFTDPRYPEANRLRVHREQQEVVNQLKELTGFDMEIKIVDTPEDVINKVSEEVLNWVKILEQNKENMSLTLSDEPPEKRDFVFVDDKLYIHVEGFEFDLKPHCEYLMKRDVSVVEAYYGNRRRVYIRNIEMYLSEADEKRLMDYMEALYQWQIEEIKKIQKQIDRKDKIKELLHLFYKKEVKNRFQILYLDALLSGNLELDQYIRKFSKYLLKKEYVSGKDYLLMEVVRKKVAEECLRDLAKLFQHRSEELFQNPLDMSYEDCLKAYSKRLFSNVDNDEDVAAFTAFLLVFEKIEMKENFLDTVSMIRRDLKEVNEETELEDYEAYLLSENSPAQWDITMVDEMDGHNFEQFLSELFTRLGYNTEVTKGSGDYGIDLLANKKNLKIGIQAKCYSDKVPNRAVQEVIAGLSYYGLDQGMVVTNNYFTEAAKNQAKKANIILWDRDELMRQMGMVFQ